jgi:hypothetical protein
MHQISKLVPHFLRDKIQAPIPKITKNNVIVCNLEFVLLEFVCFLLFGIFVCNHESWDCVFK